MRNSKVMNKGQQRLKTDTGSPISRIHATNVIGLGAMKVVDELLHAFDELQEEDSGGIDYFLPTRGALASFSPTHKGSHSIHYQRKLPRLISRVLECLFMGKKFCPTTGKSLLTLGDIPLRGCRNQIVLIHQSNNIPPSVDPYSSRSWTYRFSRLLFRLTHRSADHFIVQTPLMKENLNRAYPYTSGRTTVLYQPPPAWVTERPFIPEQTPPAEGLQLFYPAGYYENKNHRILQQVGLNPAKPWPVKELHLTIPTEHNPSPKAGWIYCQGRLNHEQCMQYYSKAHALLFPSLTESYGLPLVEAMALGLPIVASDLPYARVLCEDQAVYFDPEDSESLRLALIELQKRLIEGWKPDWTRSLSRLPSTWKEVALEIQNIVQKNA